MTSMACNCTRKESYQRRFFAFFKSHFKWHCGICACSGPESGRTRIVSQPQEGLQKAKRFRQPRCKPINAGEVHGVEASFSSRVWSLRKATTLTSFRMTVVRRSRSRLEKGCSGRLIRRWTIQPANLHLILKRQQHQNTRTRAMKNIGDMDWNLSSTEFMHGWEISRLTFQTRDQNLVVLDERKTPRRVSIHPNFHSICSIRWMLRLIYRRYKWAESRKHTVSKVRKRHFLMINTDEREKILSHTPEACLHTDERCD